MYPAGGKLAGRAEAKKSRLREREKGLRQRLATEAKIRRKRRKKREKWRRSPLPW